MSSSLLLGSYVAQDQQQSAHIQNESTPITYQFYNGHEETFFEETSKYLSSISPTNQSKFKKCTCCPFGFHIDLDFIRYCEELAANGKRCPSNQLDRRNKRRQRKSLEVMLGYEDQWILDFERDSQSSKQHKSQFQTVYEAIDNVEYVNELNNLSSQTYKQNPDQGDFMNNILSDVYSDFERTLERTSIRGRKSSCISKNNSHSDDKQSDWDIVHYTTKASDSVPALHMHSSTAENIIIEETAAIEDDRSIFNDEASSVTKTNEHFSHEIDRLSLVNRSLGDQLQSVRNQLSDNLNRVRDFEERVKLIPKLQLELSVEKAENRDMHLKLKTLENALKRKEQNEEKAIETTKLDKSSTQPFNTQRVCATSLESLNVRFPSSISLTEPQQSNKSVSCQIKTQPSTHNVGCMTTKLLLRDIGIVTIPEQIPSRTVAINTDISEKNPFQMLEKPEMKSVSVQSDLEQNLEARNIAIITDSKIEHPLERKSVGVMAAPNVKGRSCMACPEIKSIGIDNIYQKTKTRSFGTDPIKHLTEPILSKQSDSPISLKSLNNIQIASVAFAQSEAVPVERKKIEQPKEFRSIGIQYSPTSCDKFIQCKKEVVEPLRTVQMRTESTDTSDLTLRIHRGSNTELPVLKKDRLTNTDRIMTDVKSTNTMIEHMNIQKSGTNTESEINLEDQSSQSTHLNEHKCHNCLAKIEIKQRTIVKNPNKSQNASNIASNSTTIDETIYNEESLMNSMQPSDLQSRIPRPTALISPRSEKQLTRQNTYTIHSTPLPSPPTTFDIIAATQCPAEVYLSSNSQTATSAAKVISETQSNISDTSKYQNRDDENRVSSSASAGTSTASVIPRDASGSTKEPDASGISSKQTPHCEDDEPKLWIHSMKSSSTYSQLNSSTRSRQKVKPSKEMQAALKVINDSLLKGQHLATTLKNANKIVQKEWFSVSSTENAKPFEVEDYLDYFEEYSPDLLRYMVNLTDPNGNSAMHYAVSHGSFDIVSILLDSKVCNINHTNNAGYTCVMLVSLAKLDVAEHQSVVQRLFQMSDVNVRAKKHSQTALMLATSHGNYNMVRMLLDAGADINIQDEDGSTALMCAAEHGRMGIIKILLAQPDCDSTIQDLDGSTALKISLEAGYRDIGVLLYAHEYMIKNKSPYRAIPTINVGRSQKTASSLYSSSNALQGNASNSNIAATTTTSEDPVNNINKHE